jgi:hypothetical protein
MLSWGFAARAFARSLFCTSHIQYLSLFGNKVKFDARTWRQAGKREKKKKARCQHWDFFRNSSEDHNVFSF